MKNATHSSPKLTQVSKLFKDAPIAALESDAHGALRFLTNLRSSKGEHPRMANLCFVRAFGAIASVIAGRPVALGEHWSLAGLSDPVTAAAACMELS